MNLNELQESEFSQSPHFLLIGNPVAHSISPLMHNTAAEYYNMSVRYFSVALDSSELGTFAAYLNNENLKGINITIPYKQLVMDYVDELTEECRHIGAVNTMVKDENRVIGYNTDAYGFLKPLEKFKNELTGGRAIIFGTGGASKAIVYALSQWGVKQIILVSRNANQKNLQEWSDRVQFCTYDAWTSFAEEAAIIINATPLGMEPHIKGSPVDIDEQHVLENKICYDIVYKPRKTTFLKMAEEVDARTIGGLEMLIQQGSRSFKLWTGKPFPIEHIQDTLNNYFSDAD